MRYTFKDVYISIHALREEGDEDTGRVVIIFLDFYPRPPRGGRQKGCQGGENSLFLSTPSARRATSFVSYTLFSRSISIHALREEGDEG